jgi:hypothetical protein
MSTRILALTLVTMLGACAAEPKVQLNNWTPEAAGANCALGGLKVTAGIDTSNDGVLDDGEVTTTEYLCNGATGSAHLTDTVAEPAGDNCVRGGYRVNFGVDTNGDGALGDDEVTASEYLCNPERPTEGNLVMSRTPAAAADALCPGGYVMVSYGFDLNGDAELSAEEITGGFNVCNQRPEVSLVSSITVDNCGEAIELSATATDSDGSIASYAWSVLSSGSDLTLSGADTASVTVAAGEHRGGASLALVVTDDTGGETTKVVSLTFRGEGCLSHNSFYGVDPASCVAVDVELLAGDDRGGAIVSSQYVYYNGDDGLVRTDRNLEGLMSVGPGGVDVLFSVDGALHALWSSELTVEAIGDAREDDLGDDGDLETWDQIAAVDEDGLRVGAKTTLSEPVRLGSHTVQVDGDPVFRRVYRVLTAASGDVLVVMLRGYENLPGGRQQFIRTSLYNLDSGELTSSSALYETNENRALFRSIDFATQETNFVFASVVSSVGSAPVLVYRNSNGEWVEYNVEENVAEVVSTSFADDCDVASVALANGNTTAYFHDEGNCFSDLNTDESLIKCGVLYSSNLEGQVDDSGYGAGAP